MKNDLSKHFIRFWFCLVAVEMEVAFAAHVDIHGKQTDCSEWKRTEQASRGEV